MAPNRCLSLNSELSRIPGIIMNKHDQLNLTLASL